jgi:hypothetical protein
MSEQKEIGARARLQNAEEASTRPGSALRLDAFLKSFERKAKLSRKDRLRIVEQALLLLNMNYVHLPLKRAMHAVDPIQRLKLMRFRLLEMKESEFAERPAIPSADAGDICVHARFAHNVPAAGALQRSYRLSAFSD